MPVSVEVPFQEIPTLDWSLVDRSREDQETFLGDLRHALVNVGFMYLKKSDVSSELMERLIGFIPNLFDLPLEKKKALSMINTPHFLGYSAQGAEFTKGSRDNREQFDFGTDWNVDWKEGDLDWKRLWGPPQFPSDEDLSGFKATVVEYLEGVAKLGMRFVTMVERALRVPEGSIHQFYDEHMQQRCKIVKYPAVDLLRPEDGNQGVGPHFDHGFLTFLVQASEQRGLQVQNRAGEWIDAPPVHGSFVVNIGKALEQVTQKVAIATSHRVLSPPKGSGIRYSVPYFQPIALNALVAKPVHVPQDILDLKRTRGEAINTDSVNYSEYNREVNGQVQLIGRIKSHPDVGERHYPRLFKELFPAGAPSFGSSY